MCNIIFSYSNKVLPVLINLRNGPFLSIFLLFELLLEKKNTYLSMHHTNKAVPGAINDSPKNFVTGLDVFKTVEKN